MRRWIGWFAILIISIFLREYYLQYTNFLRLSDNKSVIVSAGIPAHTSVKQEEIKTVSLVTGTLIQPELTKWLRKGKSF